MPNTNRIFDLRSLSSPSFSCCPRCGSRDVKRNGHSGGRQRWLCRRCGRTFSGRTGTVLASSKLRPGQIRRIVSLLEDGVLLNAVAHQAGVSLQTAVLWKRKLQGLVPGQGKALLSGKIWADFAFVSVPARERSLRRMRGLSRDKLQVAVAVDEKGRVLAVTAGRGMPGGRDAERAFVGHVAPGSSVVHDEGHFGDAFSGCREEAVNSGDPSAHARLNPANRLCRLVKRLFAVHLRIRPWNRQKYLDELSDRLSSGLGYRELLRESYRRIFLSCITLRRKDVCRC